MSVTSKRTSKRIVLVDPLGEVLFSGESMIATAETEAQRAARDACPETQRSPSDGSGVFRAVRPVSIDGEDADIEAEISTQPRKTA